MCGDGRAWWWRDGRAWGGADGCGAACQDVAWADRWGHGGGGGGRVVDEMVAGNVPSRLLNSNPPRVLPPLPTSAPVAGGGTKTQRPFWRCTCRSCNTVLVSTAAIASQPRTEKRTDSEWTPLSVPRTATDLRGCYGCQRHVLFYKFLTREVCTNCHSRLLADAGCPLLSRFRGL